MTHTSKTLAAAAVLGLGLAVFHFKQPHPFRTVGSHPVAEIPSIGGQVESLTIVTKPEPTDDAGQALFDKIGSLNKGEVISLPLPGGTTTAGKLNYVHTYSNDATASGGELADGGGTFEIARERGGFRGFILWKKATTAVVYSTGAAGQLEVARRPVGEVICEPDPNFKPQVNPDAVAPEKAAIYNGGRSVGIIYEPIPILNSLPRAEATIYLDFDGEVIEGQSWEGGRRIVAPAYNLSVAEITDMWKRVAEDYAPFEVNVTTDLQAYLRAPQGRRMRCITTTNNFAAAGGVAFNNTFIQSGDTCCWNFYSGNAGAVVISHEVGHTFNLAHDDTTTAGYYSGHGSGATSWGPIMGAPYNQTVCQWSKGDYLNANQHQDDLSIIGASAAVRADEEPSTADQAVPLTIGTGGSVSNSGIIQSPDDIDTFIFTTAGGSLNLQFQGAPPSPNLDIDAKLYNAAGSLVASASPSNQLNASLNVALSAGTYTVSIDGVGNGTWATNGYDDYGSIGGYTITGTVPTPEWRFRIASNALSGTVIGKVAPGGTGYSIIGGNTGSAFMIDSSTGDLRVSSAAALAGSSQFALSVSFTSGGTPMVATVPVVVAPPRGLKEQIFTNLGGNDIAAMTSNANYPNNPAITNSLTTFQASRNGSNFGRKISGYLLPTESGNHVFWTSGDDSTELWLSTDANPANKVRIAFNTTNTFPGEWTAQGGQQSNPITLVSGQRYYIELLQRNNGGADYLAVAWQSPTRSRRLIPRENLEYPGSLPNRAPWLANRTYRVAENSGLGAVVATLEGGDFEPGSTLSNFTITGGNTGNAFALGAATGVLTVNGPLSFATLGKYLLDVRATDSGGLASTGQIAVEITPLAVKRQVWTGISGNDIVNLTSISTYPNSPNSTTYISFFETPVDGADNYGQRLSGYIRAPESGSYTFWIASDDDGELWLSTDETTGHKKKIASVDGATGSREWGKFSTQKSVPISLVGGKFYYVEALHKEGAGGDNLAVSWSGPDFGQVMLGAPHVTQQFYNHAGPVLDDRNVTTYDRGGDIATLEAKDWSDPGTQVTYSITAGNDDGAFTINPLTGVISRSNVLLPVGTRVLTVTVTDTGITPLSDTALITVNVLRAALKREVWTGLDGGQDLTGLTNSVYFPRTPNETGYLGSFEAPGNIGDNYGQRVSGFVVPPTTGNYTFWIASDDGGELRISTDGNPANRRKIASVTGSVGSRNWNAQSSQQSVVIPLVAGQAYFIEALQKEGGGEDYLAVAWQGPGISQQVIPNANLSYPDDFRPGLRREDWNTGNSISWSRDPVTNTMRFSPVANPPVSSADFVGTLFNFEAPTDSAENFSQRISGFLVPSATGDYTFWIASDDDGELLISSDESPGNLSSIARVDGFVASRQWDVNPSQKSPVRRLVAGQRYYIEARHRDGSFGDHLSVAWQGPGFTREIIGNAFLEHPASPTERSVPRREVWTGIAGGDVANLTSAAIFPASPTTDGTLAAEAGFVAPTNAADNFGERVSAWLLAPEDGRFTFWIASDDSSELWLSTDENPVNRVRIATENGAVTAQNWDAQASQKSVPIALKAGGRYYLEALHKDGTGGDHLAVAWQGPSFGRRVLGNRSLENPLVVPGRATLKRELWTGIAGDTLANLAAAGNFIAARPDARGVLTTFESLADQAENFGERVTARLVPPESGNYKFWIASDNDSELWLSTDSNPTSRMRIANVTGVTNPREWTRSASQESGSLPLIAGVRYHIEVLHKDGIGSDHMAVAWQGPSFQRQIIDGRFLEYPGDMPTPASLKREVWTGVGGNDVANLTSLAGYPASPNQTGTLNDFEAPQNAADNYGQKVSGFVIAPVTGSYQFWIASDDGGDLWLSTTADPAAKTRIAYTTGATGVRDWQHFPTQASAAITLTAGQRCYIEALQKEGGGDDYLAVAWQGPGFSRRIVEGGFLDYPGLLPGTTQPTSIVPPTGIDPGFAFWLDFNHLAGTNRSSSADPDGDGIPNSLEFVLGGIPSGPGADSMGLLPTSTIDPVWLNFEYRRADVSLAAGPFAQYCTDLSGWTRSEDGVAGVSITTEDDAFGPGVDRVTVRVPRIDRPVLFLRLNPNLK